MTSTATTSRALVAIAARARAVLAALLLAIAAAGVACGGGGGEDGASGALTTENYFERLEEIAVQYDEEGLAIEEEFDFTTAQSEQELIARAQGFFREGREVFGTFVENLVDLDPPDELAEAHNEAVASGRDALERFSELAELVQDVETEAELLAAFEAVSPEDEALERFSASCLALQSLAEEHGVDIDLRCG